MIKFLGYAAAISIICCQWLIYCYAPIESGMGLIQKIFYLHLPLAWWGLFSFFLVFAGSLLFLKKRVASIDNLCAAAAEIGLVFSGLALVTGMIWAKKSWGVWWTWDPRLSATLVMWFIYSAYVVARQMDIPQTRKRMICAVIGIVAFLDIPLVFLSARIFRSIHPAVFASREGGLDPEMKITVFACVFALGLLWLGILLLRKRQLDLSDRIGKLSLDLILNENQKE